MTAFNKMIAEFMGMTCHRIGDEEYEEYEWMPRFEHSNWSFKEPPPFDKSWDWLMPVVEKISKLGLGPTDNDNVSSIEIEGATKQSEVCMLCLDTSMEDVYAEIIKFITWYNSVTQQALQKP